MPGGHPWETREQLRSFLQGTPGCGEEMIDLVRRSDFDVAYANVAQLVTRCPDPYSLPRLLVRDWSGEKYARQLKRGFGA